MDQAHAIRGCRWLLAAAASTALCLAWGCTEDAGPTTEAIGIPCPDGHLLDHDLACVPEACGYGTWGSLDAGPDTIHVAADAADGGVGSQGSPYRSIQEGLDAAAAAGGGRVVVAAGSYGEALELTREHDGVEIVGRCPPLVSVVPSIEGGTGFGVYASGMFGSERWSLSGVSVRDGSSLGVALMYGELELTDVVLEGNTGAGLLVGPAGLAVLDGVEIRDTRPDQGQYGWGISAESGGHLDIRRARLSGNHGIGVYLEGAGTEARVSGLYVGGTHRDDGTDVATGIRVVQGAVLDAQDCTVDDNADIGIQVKDPGTRVRLAGLVLRGTYPWAGEVVWGHGIEVTNEARVEILDALIELNHNSGIVVSGEGTSALLDRVEIRQTHVADRDGALGALHVSWGADMQARYCVVERNDHMGVYVADEDSHLRLVDSVVRETLPLVDGEGGMGIQVIYGATLTAEQCRLEDNSAVGLLVAEPGSRARLVGVEVLGTRRTSVFTQGVGVVAQYYGVVHARDLYVGDSEGVGLLAMNSAGIECDGCSIIDSQFAGVNARSLSDVRLRDSLVSGVEPEVNLGGGVGVLGFGHLVTVDLTVRDTVVEGAPLAALWLDGDGSYTVEGSTLIAGPGLPMDLPDGSTVLMHGDAVVATGGVMGLVVEDCSIEGAPRTGVLLDGSTAWLGGNVFLANATDLAWQDCDGIEVPPVFDGVGSYDERCERSALPVISLEFSIELEEEEVQHE